MKYLDLKRGVYCFPFAGSKWMPPPKQDNLSVCQNVNVSTKLSVFASVVEEMRLWGLPGTKGITLLIAPLLGTFELLPWLS